MGNCFRKTEIKNQTKTAIIIEPSNYHNFKKLELGYGYNISETETITVNEKIIRANGGFL